MTDLETIKMICSRSGVEFIEDKGTISDDGRVLEFQQGSSGVGGYAEFSTTMEFDRNGKLIEISAWE